MKTPWSIKIIRFFSILSAVGSLLFISYVIWAVDNIPTSEFWGGFRDGLVSVAANSETGVYGFREAGAYSFTLMVSALASFLVLFFLYRRSLNGIRIVFIIEILLAFGQESIPFLSVVLLVLTFMKSAKDFLNKIDSNQVDQATGADAAVS